MGWKAMVIGMMLAGQTAAETLFDDFSGEADTRWDYVADGVMGGVSSGTADIIGSGAQAILRLRGTVSTENNGGFIQVRRRFDNDWPRAAEGLRLTVKGNGALYYVFLKTPNLSRIWHSYRASFVAPAHWQTIDLPFDMFGPSHMGMPAMYDPLEVTSVAIVAYGDDYEADISVREISLF
ncbi:CIA30 family protein [Marivita sp. XM-24bin2]|nr:CIA30 family protein [Marivita sp. XM-24bin2]